MTYKCMKSVIMFENKFFSSISINRNKIEMLVLKLNTGRFISFYNFFNPIGEKNHCVFLSYTCSIN